MADISFAEHPLEFQIADRLVRAWISEQHGYLKDGGGSQGMHRVPRDALIAAIASAFGPYVTIKADPVPERKADPRRKPLPVEGFLESDNAGPMIVAASGGMSFEDAHAETIRLRDVSEAAPDPAPKRKPRQKKVAE